MRRNGIYSQFNFGLSQARVSEMVITVIVWNYINNKTKAVCKSNIVFDIPQHVILQTLK